MGRQTRRRRWTALAGALSLGGCQLLVPTDPQCTSNADCEERGGTFANTVCIDAFCLPEGDRCLGHVTPIVEDPQTRLKMRMRFVDVPENGIAGVEVLVCASRDEACRTPLATAITDGQGYVLLPVAKNFRGTFQVHNPPAGSDLMKTKVHLFRGQATDDDPNLQIPATAAVHLVARAVLNEQVKARSPLDPNAGHILGGAVDCTLTPRAGVAVSLTTDLKDRVPLQFYFTRDQSASVTATETSAQGEFGFANVPEGPVVLEATIPALGRKSAHVELWINKDTISTFLLAPTFVAQ